MFIHHIKYAFKGMLREREGIFWACLFPFLLGTLFNVTFGHINERAEQVHEIRMAVVVTAETQNAETFVDILDEVENESGQKLFDVKKMSEKEAKKQLKDEEIAGYYVIDEDITLNVEENGMNQTFLSIFLDNYNQQAAIIEQTAKEAPQNLEKVIQELQREHTFYSAVNESEGNMDNTVEYFYALMAMTCMFGSFLSIERTKKLQADMSPLGMRRGISAAAKSTAVLAEFVVCLAIQTVIGVLIFAYLINVCHIGMGNRYGYMMLVYIVGSAFGIALGIFIGSLSKVKESVRVAIQLGFSLGSCFLSGMMVSGVKQLIEDTVPIVNRLNPSALITDALYSLNVFDSMERYYQNVAILTGLTVLLCAVAIIQTRRVKYASL